MPITCQLIQGERLAIFTHVGLVSDDEFLDRYRASFEDPQFDTSYDLLVDLRQTNSSVRGTKVLSQLAEYMWQLYAEAKSAPKVAVLAPGQLSFGLARMFESFSHDVKINFRVFRTAKSGLTWLERPPDLLPSVDVTES